MNNLQQSERSETDPDTSDELALDAFSGYPEDAKLTLLEVRELIYAIQKKDTDIGHLHETLRWGELSFLTQKPNTGSIIRLALNKRGEPAIFLHCGTMLVETFRTQYTHVLDFESNRAIILRKPIEEISGEISSCLSQALRYKLDKQN